MVNLSLSLPYPPSINHYYVRCRNHVAIGKAGREYRAAVAQSYSAIEGKPLTCRLKIEVSVFPPDKRRRDIDNVLKALLDAMQHAGVYADDAQIVDLHITKKPPRKGGYVWITIEEA